MKIIINHHYPILNQCSSHYQPALGSWLHALLTTFQRPRQLLQNQIEDAVGDARGPRARAPRPRLVALQRLAQAMGTTSQGYHGNIMKDDGI